MRIFVTLFVESVICVILGYGGYLVYDGVFNAGQLVEFIGYFTAIVWPIMAVSDLIDMSSRGKASLNRVAELLEAKCDVTDSENVTDVEALKGDIEFRNLTFRYPDGEFDVLENVSFKIKAGENVGIIGKTGAGKTTLVDLILRTYNVPDGTLFIDGHDVNTIPIRTVRKYAAYVPQDNFLFGETIESNIAFATDGGNHDDVETAAKLSDIHDNIMEFPEGYDTMLGERGVTVSGGDPLLHPDFLEELLRRCHEKAYNVVLESELCVPTENLERVMPYINLYYTDCKIIDPEAHKRIMGASNDVILKNLRLIGERCPERMVLRTPIIPGYTDSDENIDGIAKFAAECHFPTMNILPYHKLGVTKHERLGSTYLLPDVQPPSDARMRELADIIESHGVKCIIN